MIRNGWKRLIASGNFYSLLGNLIFAIFGFAGFLLLTRMLNKEDFGAWVLFLTMTSLFDMFRLGLTGTAAIRMISSDLKSEKHAIAASYQLGFLASLITGMLFLALFAVVPAQLIKPAYSNVLFYYPLLAIANLPFNQALVVAQGKIDFKKIFVLRALNGFLVFVFVWAYVSLFGKTAAGIIVAYILANALCSLFVSIKGYDGLRYIFLASRKEQKQILNFGKYSTASYIGSNLLRSSDTILLSMASFMGPSAIAVYAIPLKFVEIVEIPLRSFTATAFPRLSKAFSKNPEAFGRMIKSYLFWSTIILVPFVTLLVSSPAFFLKLLGGARYIDSLEVQQQIVYVISVYILLLPLDRYSGVALFAIEKPKLNFYKIMLMLTANIIFDMIAIFVFHSLVYVALGTLFFTIIGMVWGWSTFLAQMGHDLNKSFVSVLNKITYMPGVKQHEIPYQK